MTGTDAIVTTDSRHSDATMKASSPADIADVLELGVSAALAASIFHDGIHTVEEVKHTCRERNLPMR